MAGEGEKMIIKRAEALRLARTLFDEDKEEALFFLKERLRLQSDQATRDRCVPVFEASYKPHQKDSSGKH